MKSGADLVDTVACIYRTALEPDGHWTEALDRIAHEMGAASGNLLLADPLRAELCVNGASSLYQSYSQEQLQQWAEDYGKSDMPTYHAFKAMRKVGFLSDMQMLGYESEAQHAEHLSIKYAIKYFGTRHRAGTRLSLHNAWLDILAVQYAAERGPVTPDEAATGGLLIPHMAKSVEMQRSFAMLRNRHDAVIAALDRWHIGICIVLCDGRSVLTNSHADAILDSGDGLTLDRNGYLAGPGGEQNSALQKAIFRASKTASGSDDKAETLLALERRSGEEAYLVSISPLGDDGRELDRGFAGALVAIIDPTKSKSVSTAGMGEVYDLTRTEQEVCRLLAEGRATGDIAEIRNLQLETVRSYIKSILAKTRTHSRADLVRLAVLLNPPIDAPDEKP